MNKVVRDHYPVSKLPDDLRAGLDPSMDVRIVLEPAATDGHEAEPLTSILEAMRDRRTLSADPVTRVRALRAEWDDREDLHRRIRSGYAG